MAPKFCENATRIPEVDHHVNNVLRHRNPNRFKLEVDDDVDDPGFKLLSHVENLEVYPRSDSRSCRGACESDSIGESDELDNEVRYGIVTIGNNPEGITVRCGNLIFNKDVNRMKERVSLIEGKDKDELKKLYKKQMMEGPEEGSKGASLGFLEMARRTGYPLEFSFEEVSDDYTFFCINAII